MCRPRYVHPLNALSVDISPGCLAASERSIKIHLMKTFTVHGAKLSSLQSMMFDKYISSNNIAMNTKTPDERKAIVITFINEVYYKQKFIY
jgi:hypothetical protein